MGPGLCQTLDTAPLRAPTDVAAFIRPVYRVNSLRGGGLAGSGHAVGWGMANVKLMSRQPYARPQVLTLIRIMAAALRRGIDLDEEVVSDLGFAITASSDKIVVARQWQHH